MSIKRESERERADRAEESVPQSAAEEYSTFRDAQLKIKVKQTSTSHV